MGGGKKTKQCLLILNLVSLESMSLKYNRIWYNMTLKYNWITFKLWNLLITNNCYYAAKV